MNIHTLSEEQFAIVKKFMRINEHERTAMGLKMHFLHNTKQRDAAAQSACDPASLSRSVKSAMRVIELLHELCELPDEFSTRHYKIMCKLMRLRETKTQKGARQVLIEKRPTTYASAECSVARSSISKLAKAIRTNYQIAKSFKSLHSKA